MIKNFYIFFKKFLIFTIFVLSYTQMSFAADITLSPSMGDYQVGESFSVDVFVRNNQDPINRISSSVVFSSDTLELVSISKSASIITIWAQEPTFSNTNGTVSFEGVIFYPGFNSSKGKIVSLNFKAKKKGFGTVTLTSGSVLANDGNATNVLGTLGSASFDISDDSTIETTPAPVAT